ncbi:MAG: tRNA (adenosine(37)-N6)-threonylcarbamoyltransferase complex transferase subunit TsaD [Candidatus Wolfebacteria bacterium]|nr:tRNA (adenosine(37)-N6)-threonylcarbamoyltransferase complex transferase subunit TsaD [Candidatus Wolfebacteria bacterium]
MKILAIETSCDETAIALVDAKGGVKQPRFKIEKNLVASQIKIHRPFGGVVPNLAKREHLKNLPILFKKLVASGYSLNPDLIAVTVGPGLEPALWTGINFAKELHKKLKIKILGVNHLEGHLYSPKLEGNKNLDFPAIALIISGGHTILLNVKNMASWKKIGETVDDAVGECYDKTARLLNLPYPGGPEIEKLAKDGDPNTIQFPRPMIHQKNYDFSFSGLKTSVLYFFRENKNEEFVKKYKLSKKPEKISKADIAASFQQAVFDVLTIKTLRAVKEIKAKSLIIGGGVAANRSLQKAFKKKIKKENLKLNLFIPSPKFCTDNAAIIAAAGYISFLKNKKMALKAQANLNL